MKKVVVLFYTLCTLGTFFITKGMAKEVTKVLEDGSVEKYELVYGKIDGKMKKYDPMGNLLIEGSYKEGLSEGEWKSYYPDGKVQEILNFQNGERNGKYVAYFQNGQIDNTGYYLSGEREGQWFFYTEDGNLMLECTCHAGKCKTSDGDEVEFETVSDLSETGVWIEE